MSPDDRDRLRRLWAEHEAGFSKLQQETKEALSDAEWKEVQHFIDVGEYGLALETFVDIVAEEKKTLTQFAVSIAKDLAAAMGYVPNTIFDQPWAKDWPKE